MPGVSEYIEEFGERSFEELPFGDADNLTLCQLIYMPLEKAVGADFDAEPVPLADACRHLFALNGYAHKRLGLVLSKDYSINMMKMAAQPRFASLKLVAARGAYDRFPPLQYGCCTALLPDGTAVVLFRGTDDTIAGWQEDLDLYLRHGARSYPLAKMYLKEVAARFNGDIILCGHSKGGNIALYTALTAEKEIRDRIRTVYNNEGPGFDCYRLYHTEAYEELLLRYRHFVPPSSFLGMMLAHDYDYTVVENSRHIGLIQHDLSFWQIRDGKLVTRPDINLAGKFADAAFAELIFRLDGKNFDILNEVAERMIRGAKVENLTDAVKKLPKTVAGVLMSWLTLPKDKQKLFRSTLHGVTATFVKTVVKFRRNTVPKWAADAAMVRKDRAAVQSK